MVSPWLVYLDWFAIRPLYGWNFVDFVENNGAGEELTFIVLNISLVAALAAAIGIVSLRRPLGAHPALQRSLLFAMVGVLLVTYGVLAVGADLTTLLIVGVDGGGLPLWRRAAWMSGPTPRAVAVLASLASACVAVQPD